MRDDKTTENQRILKRGSLSIPAIPVLCILYLSSCTMYKLTPATVPMFSEAGEVQLGVDAGLGMALTIPYSLAGVDVAFAPIENLGFTGRFNIRPLYSDSSNFVYGEGALGLVNFGFLNRKTELFVGYGRGSAAEQEKDAFIDEYNQVGGRIYKYFMQLNMQVNGSYWLYEGEEQDNKVPFAEAILTVRLAKTDIDHFSSKQRAREKNIKFEPFITLRKEMDFLVFSAQLGISYDFWQRNAVYKRNPYMLGSLGVGLVLR